MNQEEKARAYDEALERAKAYHRNELAGSRKEMMEYIFPQLRESEDERIRKYLIGELKTAKSVGELKFTIPQPTREECIAYLEKQKEQNHDRKKWIYEDDYDKDMERTFNDGKDEVLENPEKYGLCKKAKWSEEDEKHINLILRVLDIQQCWDGATGNKFNPYQGEIDWLKSFRPSWKPSEEQMKGLKDVIETVPMSCRQQQPLESLYADLQKL